MADETIAQDENAEKQEIKWQGLQGETNLLNQVGCLSMDAVQSDLGSCTDTLYLIKEHLIYAGGFDSIMTVGAVISALSLVYKALHDFENNLFPLCRKLEDMHKELVALHAGNEVCHD